MIGLLQRVSRADVAIDGAIVAEIGLGLLVLVGVERDDGEREVRRLAERLLAYRVFPDRDGRMNLSVSDVGGEVLLVPQFTLAADTRKGNRPGFSRAADPERGEALFGALAAELEQLGTRPACGRFGADMQVSLINDGPVTIWLQV
ncbi:D-aminoacyl-tRNA deacylase [Candidatus Rariloculus sp.]|uniref:D-aminoacyl-tRNA deacylase n=1 Tax=Candidatus Rariloculus sp. TaxID=3101265 RepID=UPI003D10370C